jgi:acyl-CoA thioesterase FadM
MLGETAAKLLASRPSGADRRMGPPMQNWIETYRGTVPPWQCDVTEHFTIAYYFDRLDEAEPNFAESARPRRITAGRRLLRAGSMCGSRANCAPAAAFMSKRAARLRGRAAARPPLCRFREWRDRDLDRGALGAAGGAGCQPRAAGDRRPAGHGKGRRPSAAGAERPCRLHPDRARPGQAGDLDPNGHFGWPDGASLYRCLHPGRRGDRHGCGIHGERAPRLLDLRAGTAAIRLAGARRAVPDRDRDRASRQFVAAPGASISQAQSGKEVARLGQYGVNLDLDARRPAKFPDDIRARAAALVVPVE